MTSIERFVRLTLGFLAIAIPVLLASCNIAKEDGNTFMHVKYDTAWAKFDTVEISWADSTTGKGGILFRGEPGDLAQDNKLLADGYQGQEIEIRIKGIIGDKIAFEEKRTFKGENGGPTVKEIITAYVPKTDSAKVIDSTKVVDPVIIPPYVQKPNSPRITTFPRDTTLTIKDFLDFEASAGIDSGILKGYAWDYDGDGAFEDSLGLGEATALLKGRSYYPVKGVFQAALKVVAATDSVSIARFKITVLEDRPLAYAGRDTTVYPGSAVRLRGSAQDSLGEIAKTEWKLGGALFQAASAETTFTVGNDVEDIQCIFRATDDDGLSATDTMIVHVVSQTESNLTDIFPSRGRLSPQFSPAVTFYADTVSYAVNSLTLTANGNGVIKLDGSPLVSGVPSSEIELKVGANIALIEVKNTGSVAKTYTVEIHRMPASNDTRLTDLKVAGGIFEKALDPADTAFAAFVSNATDSVTVTAVLSSGLASLAINDLPVKSGAVSGRIGVETGVNRVKLAVTAENGDVRMYALRIIRAGNGNSDLGSLSLSVGAISPVFNPEILTYSLTVPFTAASTKVTAATVNPLSTLSMNETAALSGSPVDFNLPVGNTSIGIVVTAQNGDKKTYTVTVTRTPDNADLAGIALSSDSLNPVFSPAVTEYSVSVGNATTSLTVTPSAALATSGIKVNEVALPSAGSTAVIALDTGSNRVKIEVTSGTSIVKTYSLIINRGLNGNADLDSLIPYTGSLSPAFNPADTLYEQTLSNGHNAWRVTAKTASPTSKVTINGVEIPSGTQSGNLPLVVGNNWVTIVVTAQNGAKKTYMANFIRPKSGFTLLEGLSLSAGQIVPYFSQQTTSYTYTVANSVTSTKVTVTRGSILDGSVQTITINGKPALSRVTESDPIPLKSGLNPIEVIVTAPNGATRTYTITVKRPIITDASLSSLAMVSTGGSGSDTVPVFQSMSNGTMNYYACPTNSPITFKVIPTVNAAGITVKVNDVSVASGTASQDLQYFKSGIKYLIEVTSADGDTKKLDTLNVVPPSEVGHAVANNLQAVSKTFDAGATWIQLMTNALYHPFAVDFTDVENGCMVGSMGAILRTSDGGAHWDLQASNTSWNLWDVQFINATSAVAVGDNGTIVKSTDGGRNWAVKPSPQNHLFWDVEFPDANVGYATTYGGLVIRTKDGGETWEQMTYTPHTVQDIEFFDAARGYAVGEDGKASSTVDSGKTWTPLTTGITTPLYDVECTAPNICFIAGQDGSIYNTDDFGATWNSVYTPTGVAASINQIYFPDWRRGFAIGNGGLTLKTTDQGKTWQQVSPPGAPYSNMSAVFYPEF
jgi:photosystem II stability/assembly factor-like uncharacterized protein